MSELISASDLVQRLRQRDLRVPFEIGTFITLEVTECLLAAPRMLDSGTVHIDVGGQVSVAPGPSCASQDATEDVREILLELLVAAGAGVPPGLLELADSENNGDRRMTLAELRDILEASLVPLNRAASQRVLARLVRDAFKLPAQSKTRPELFEAANIDRDLDVLLETGESVAFSDAPTVERRVDVLGNEMVSFEAVTSKRAGLRPVLTGEARTTKLRVLAPSAADDAEVTDNPRHGLDAADDESSDAIELPVQRRRRMAPLRSSVWFWAGAALLLMAVALASRRYWGSSAVPRPPAIAAVARPAAEPVPVVPPTSTLEVRAVDGAWILLYEGRTPLTLRTAARGAVLLASDDRAQVVYPESTGALDVELAPTQETRLLPSIASVLSTAHAGSIGDAITVELTSSPLSARVYRVIGIGQAVASVAPGSAQELVVFHHGVAARHSVHPSDYGQGARVVVDTRQAE